MREAEACTTAPPPPERPKFQFTLRTLLLMFVVLASSLAVFGAWGILAFGVVSVLAIWLHFNGAWRPLAGCLFIPICLMCIATWPAVDAAKESGKRAWCSNNIKQIALALLSYESSHGTFPPAYVADKDGKPMHSWRVLILPDMDMNGYYRLYNFNEPWDGPTNKRLLTSHPEFYACPSDGVYYTSGVRQANYFAVIGPNAAWAGDKPKKLTDFGDEARNTILVVEARNSGVAWSEPKDIRLDAVGEKDADSHALAISSNHGVRSNFFFTYDDVPCAHAAMADGSVRFLPPGSLTPENLPKLLQIGGCRQVDLEVIANSYAEHRRLNWPNIAALAVWLISVIALLARAVRSRRPNLKESKSP
jgi:hypothetical protein